MCQILLVEDHDDTRRTFASLIRSWGHDVFPVKSVARGIAFLEVHNVDVILSDLGMPDRDGYDLMAEVRRKDQRVMAIAVSAFSAVSDRQRSREAGFDMHFPKPVDIETLRLVLARTLARAEGMRNTMLEFDRLPLEVT